MRRVKGMRDEEDEEGEVESLSDCFTRLFFLFEVCGIDTSSCVLVFSLRFRQLLINPHHRGQFSVSSES